MNCFHEKFMKNVFLALATASILSLSCAATSETLLNDSFESGDFSATNSAGFQWSSTKVSSIVTDSAQIYITEPVNNPIPAASNWDPFNGKHSMRMFYPEGQSWTEQRFKFGKGYEEIWLRYWIRVPTNFEHGTASPSNNKFFAMWMDAYSGKGEGATVFWNFWRDSDGGSSITVAYNEGNHSSSGGQAQKRKFIRVPDDRGRWMQVVFNVKASSSPDSSDGYMAFWRRWEGEKEFTQLHELEDVNLAVPAAGPDGWAKGYLMGWANAPYAADTDWLIDDFEVATHSLLSISDPKSPNPPIVQVD